MPLAQIKAPNAVWGTPVPANSGLNDQVLVECVNNSGAHLQHGDVVVWDTNTALSAVQTTTTGSQQLATTATSYAVADSSAFAATNQDVVAVGVTPTGYPQAINLVGNVSAKVDGTHITIAWSRAGAAGSLPAGTVIFVAPSSAVGLPGVVGLPGTAGDAGRAVTTSFQTAAGDLLVAGVVSLDGTAATNNGLIAPGQTVMVCVSGVARVQIGGGTVAAAALLRTNGTNPGWAIGSGTLGNLIGIALESQANKDANNTIRAAIKVG